MMQFECRTAYCQAYQHLFPEVRSFENFKYLIIGIISEIKRKSLTGIAKVVGLKNEQSLHHLLTVSPWDINACQQLRLSLILERVDGKKVILIIDETLDKKRLFYFIQSDERALYAKRTVRPARPSRPPFVAHASSLRQKPCFNQLSPHAAKLPAKLKK
ncbi:MULTISPECIES: transposase [unclassified Microcoleus]|uniref:transposase n=1 Tax=unclassified Microcoleus TaxID=2642155 RepID=UPI00403FA9A7